jgi:hypothetical protein
MVITVSIGWPLVGEDLVSLPEHLSSPPGFSGVRVTRFLVLCVCFVDCCLSLCSFSFGHCVVCTSSSSSSASVLDLYLKFDDSGQLSTKIYDIRDDFNFKIINFPNMCSNIPASPAYGVYISQLIRFARASSHYSDFLKRHLHLRNRLLDQGYENIRFIRFIRKFIFRYQDLVEIYSVSAETIISDAFSYSENV